MLVFIAVYMACLHTLRYRLQTAEVNSTRTDSITIRIAKLQPSFIELSYRITEVQ